MKNHAKKLKIPHIFIVLGAIALLMAILTYVIPAGSYERTLAPDGRSVVDPGSFTFIDKNPTTLLQFLTAFPQGLIDAGWIVILTFTIGGAFGVIKKAVNLPAIISKASQ